jgi:hypothetical protein
MESRTRQRLEVVQNLLGLFTREARERGDDAEWEIFVRMYHHTQMLTAGMESDDLPSWPPAGKPSG